MRFFKLLLFSTLLFAAGQVQAQCPSIVGATSTVTDITCFGFSDGSITLKLNSGGNPTNFELYDNNLGQTVPSNVGGVVKVIDADFRGVTFTNVYGSNFSVYIYKLGCVPNPLVYSPGGGLDVNEPAELLTNSIITPDCNPATGPGNQTGSILLNVSGGSVPYTYNWSDGPTIGDRPNIDAGTYSVTITDDNGCIVTLSNLVVPGSPTITLGSIAGVCSGVTSSSISYTTTTDSPNEYRIDWTAGITDVPFTAIPATPIPITGIPAGAGTYTGNLFVRNTSTLCESIAYPISVTVNATPALPTVTSPVTYCQNATAVALTATGSNLLWYTVSTGGTGSATAPIPSTTTVGTTSYYVSQTISGCEGPRAQIDVVVNAIPVAPTITSPITYCQNATAVALTATGSNLLWYTVSTGGTGSATAPIPSTATAGTTSYYVSQTINGCEGPRAQIDVVVNATPVAPTVTSPVTYCQNATAAALTATGSNLLWYTVSTGGTGSATAPIPSTATAGTTSYYVSQTINGCEGPRAQIDVVVNATPALPTVASPVTYCQNATAVALTATGSNLLWYTVSTGGTGSATAPIPSTTTVGTTSYFVSQTISGCEGPRAQIDVVVNATPVAPTLTSPVTYCQNATAVALTATGSNLLWYTVSTGGTGSATAPIPSTATAGTTSYFVSQTISGCEGPRAQIDVVVNATPALPTVTSPVTYCQNATAVALTATGSNLLWYTVSTGGTGSATAPIPSTTTVGTTSYYVSQTISGCEGPRAQIDVVVNATPALPTVTSPVTYCQNATAVALTATGSNLLWYTVSTGGTGSATAPIPSTATAGTTSYFVSQTISGCEGPRAQIDVVVNATPALPTITSPVTYCQNATAVALTATGSNLLWYTVSTGGTGSATAPIPSTATAGTTSYYVSQTINGCEGPRAQIDVVVNATPSLPAVTSPVTYCQNATAAALTATGSNLLWYTVSTGGTGSATAPVPSTATVGTTSYYVSQTISGCEGPRAQIDVVVNATPVAPTVTSPVTYCQNATSVALTATGSNLLWYTVSTGGTGSATAPIPLTATTGTTSYYVSQTTSGCEGPRAQIDVVVNATPVAPTVTSPVTYCQNATAVALTATGSNLLWYTVSGGGTGSATAPIPLTTTTGTTSYYVSQTISGCEGLRAQIDVVVNATPALPTVVSPVTYCQNATAVALTATGSTLLWYTVSTGGTGSATAPTPPTTTAGTTSYFVSQTINGCEGPRAQIDVIVEGPPDISLALGTTINPVCIGGLSSVTVTNSEVGVLYQLRNNTDNSLIGVAVAGNGVGLNLPSGPLSATTIFNVLASKVSCSAQLTTLVVVTVLGNIDASLPVSAQNALICEGSSTNILVDNSVTGVTYQLVDDSDDSLVGTAVSGTGGTIDLPTGLLSVSKVFYILASNGICSIELDNKATVNVDVDPDPSLSVLAALDPLCSGGSTVIIISPSEIGVSYQLRNDSDNSLIGSPLAGSGGPLLMPTGVLNTNITFNVLATGGICVPVQLSNKVTVTVAGSINLTLTPTPQLSPVCGGDGTNIQIVNSEAGVNYQLINDTDNSLLPGVVAGTGGSIDLPTGNLSAATTFRVLAINASCSAELTATATVNVTPLPVTSLAVSAVSSSVCEATSAIVQVANSEPGFTYQLRNDADNTIASGAVTGDGNTIDLLSVPLASTTTFNILATNGTCSIELSSTVTVIVNEAPDGTLSVAAQDPTVCSGTGTMVQVLNTEPGIIYQLRDDADNTAVSGAAIGNGGTINLPTGPITADRTFNVLASNTLCSSTLISKVTITLRPINDLTCSNCSLVLVSAINATKVTCNATVPDGSIEFDIQPPVPTVNIIGIKIEITGPTPKTQTDNFIFTGLAAGNYNYTVTYGDENNPDCIKTGAFIIEVTREPDLISFDLAVDEFNCLTNEGSITLSSITGSANVDYQYTVVNNGSPFTQGSISAAASSFTIGDLVVGPYQIQLSQNQEAVNGCVGVVTSQVISYTIDQPNGGCGVIIPNVFTPNGDGANDVFEIRNLPANSSVSVTNRWGKEVFNSGDYQNNWAADNISDGVYYFRIVAEGEVHTGWVEILR